MKTSKPDFGVRFGVTAAEIAYLLRRKRVDYGWQNIAESGQEGVVVRLQDKINRLRTLGANGKPNNESIADTWADVAGYGIIGLLLSRGDWITDTDSDRGGAIPLPESDEIEPTPRQWDEATPRLVYLGGPVDCTTPDRANGWRTEATKILNKNGIATYNPVAAFSWSGGTEKAHLLSTINAAALRTSPAALFHLPSDVLTVGSVVELQITWQMCPRPTVVVWGDEKVKNNLYLAMMGIPIEPTLHAAIERLVASHVQVHEC